MPGIAEEIDGAMQHAPQPRRQARAARLGSFSSAWLIVQLYHPGPAWHDYVESHPTANPSITTADAPYPHIGPMLPAAGFAPTQLAALVDTINGVDADVPITSTPAGAVTIRLSQFSCTAIANVTGKTAHARYS
jgi:hypothetical protein